VQRLILRWYQLCASLSHFARVSPVGLGSGGAALWASADPMGAAIVNTRTAIHLVMAYPPLSIQLMALV
jgi:hypothetical protein